MGRWLPRQVGGVGGRPEKSLRSWTRACGLEVLQCGEAGTGAGGWGGLVGAHPDPGTQDHSSRAEERKTAVPCTKAMNNNILVVGSKNTNT